MRKRARDYDEMRPPRKRHRLREFVSTPWPDTFMSFTYRPGASFIPLLNRFAARITALPDDVQAFLVQYMRRPRMLQAFSTVEDRFSGGRFRRWAGTEWMRRRNVVVSRTMPGDTGTYFRYPNWTLIDRLHLGMPDPVPTTRGATMTYDIGRYWDNWDRLSDFVPYVRLHGDELFSGSHDGPIDLT